MEKTQNQNEISAQAIDPTHVLAIDHPPLDGSATALDIGELS